MSLTTRNILNNSNNVCGLFDGQKFNAPADSVSSRINTFNYNRPSRLHSHGYCRQNSNTFCIYSIYFCRQMLGCG